MASSLITTFKWKPPRIIALVGAKRCGKDSVAGYLSQYDYANWKLAGRLKKICKEMFGLTDDELETDKKDVIHPKWGVTPRHIMQVFGTEITQYQFEKHGIPSVTKTFWVERFAEDLKSTKDKVVITDMRFVHEYNYLYEAFGSEMLVVKLIRTNVPSNDNHVSEREWLAIPADITIMNDSSIDDLYTKVARVLNLYT